MPIGPNGMAVRELLLGTLLLGGLPSDVAARAMATIAHYVLGFAMQTPRRGVEALAPEGVGALRGADPADFPLIASVADLLPRPLSEEFTFGLDLILTALVDRQSRAWTLTFIV